MALTRLGPNQSVNLASNVTGALPIANGGTALTSGFVNGVANPGKVLQVVQAEDSTELDLSSNTYTDVGLSASITPSATSSKVLVFWTVHSRFMTTISGFGTRLVRGSTNVWTTTRHYYIYTEDNNNDRHSTMFNYLDSPSTTSATTYKIQVATESSNQVLFNANDNQSIITLMEISA